MPIRRQINQEPHGNMVTTVIFLFFLVVHASCEQTKSLTFLIDNTRSMHTEFSQIKETAKSIVDIVTNEESCHIEDIVLVTFNDPNVQFRKRTRDALELKQSLNEITVRGGGMCPEPCLAGIKLALQESQDGSYLFVFTDASAKDYAMLEEIVSMCQEKKSQIVFVITGLCKTESDPAYQVYHKIASACNGQVFRITEGEVREVLNYVKETIRGDLTVITSQTVESNQSLNNVDFNVDDETKYVMVSVAGKQASVTILDPLGSPITEYERITWTENVKVLKLSHLPPGSYIAKVRGSAQVSINVIGRTDFTFDYGFSDNTTSSLNLTEPLPRIGASSHLIISLNDKENSVVAQTVEILDMEERVIKVLPLTNMGGKVYATEVFTPPETMFKIAVTATGRSTGHPLRRIANTPVAPIRAVIVAPLISNSEKKISIIEGSPVAIHCRIIKGNPKPQVTWFYKPPSSSTYTLLSDRTDMVFRTTCATLNDTGRYKCVAENAGGRVEHEVQLQVRAFLPSTRVPIAFVKRGQNMVIECMVGRRHRRPTITWQFKRSDTNRIYTLNTTAAVLRIENVQSIDSGYYKCSATNGLRTAQQFVQLIVGVAPQIERFPTNILKANENSTVRIDCKITEAMPPPNVTWLFKAPDGDNYQLLKANVTSLELRDVRVANNSGHYMCVAENSEGRATQEVELVVEDVPVIEINSPERKTEREGNNVVIQCRITKGSPRTNVTWQYKNSEFDIFRDINNTGEILRITNLQPINSGFYKCRASNNAGTDEKTVQIVVLVIPQIESFPSKIITAKPNSSVRIDCRVSKGTPSPNITWLFKAPDAYTYQFLKANVTSLELRDVRVANNSGHYMCVVENSAGRAAQEVELVVEDIPVIEINSPIFTEREGNNVVIQCRITKGSPRTKVTWQYKNSEFDIFRDINNTGEILRINNLQPINSGFYKCRASNNAGTDEQTVQIIVLAIPQIGNFPNNIKATQNSTVRIECNVTKGFPTPNITWLFKSSKASSYDVLNYTLTSLELVDVKVNFSGHYKCVAENSVGSAEQAVELLVEVPPRIVFSPPNEPKYRGVEGDVVMKLSCIAEGHPKPTISWTIDNNTIGTDKLEQSYVEDGSLFVKSPMTANSNHIYACSADNDFGHGYQIYEVLVSEYEDYDNPAKMYGEVGKPYEINCSLPFTDPNSVRWFYNAVYLNVTGASIRWENASQANDGNYTCRVSDLGGAASVTVELTFGLPPTSSHPTEWDVVWDVNLDITCVADMDSSGKYEWYYNGEKIEDADEKWLSVYKFGFGTYTCRASNSWGSLDLTYNITSQDCIIDKNLSKEKHMPIILEELTDLPRRFSSNQRFTVVPHSEKLNLICQVEPPTSQSARSQAHKNRFRKVPGTRSTVATCDHEDLFIIDGESYKLKELDCIQPVTPSIVRTAEECLGYGTEMINVEFFFNNFFIVYSSCLDTDRNLLLYTELTMKGLNQLWKVNEPERPCKQVDDCCYETIELVNAEDVGFGGVETTTLKNRTVPLNSVLYCRPSDTGSADRSSRQHSTGMPITTTELRIEPAETSPSSNAPSTTQPPIQEPETSWHDIERQVRHWPQTMTVWSGAGNYTRVGDMMVPQYLWKVVLDLENEKYIAIVHSNAHAPVAKLCADDCRSPSVLALFEHHGVRTYCCSLDEFNTAFNLTIEF